MCECLITFTHSYLKRKKLTTHMKKAITLFLSLFFIAQLQANNFWQDVTPTQIFLPENAEINQMPNEYRSLSLDFQAMIETLRVAPLENTGAKPIQVSLPMPNGDNQIFEIFESPIMAPGLAAKYPQIKTFAGRSLTNPSVTTRLNFGPNGFHAIVHTNGGTVIIDPYAKDQTQYYISFDIQHFDLNQNGGDQYKCETEHDHGAHHDYFLPNGNIQNSGDRSVGDPVDLYKYRVAVTTTGNFYQANGNNLPSVMSRVTTILNDVNSIWETDAAIRIELIDNADAVFFDNPATDGLTNGSPPALNDENVFKLNEAFGQDGYDIGHVFGTNAGGLAALASVCSDFTLSHKANASSSTFGAYSGALFYIIVAHEMGHQFSATHNFNYCETDPADQNQTWQTGVEPGSGSTIMCYAGASNCGANYVQDVDDDYYNINAMIRMRNFSRDPQGAGECAVIESTDNTTPTASIPTESGFFIPILTPFELTGEASDDEDTNLLYNWEQADVADTLAPLGSPRLTSPCFRSFPPTTNTTRVFPRMDIIVTNGSDKNEVLVDYSRDMTFRFSVRDQHAMAGGFDWAEIAFEITDQAGPFLVMSPNDGSESWTVGDYVEVTWDVANTDASPVNCERVNLKLSTDGGYTYPITLAANTMNDGSQFVVVPDAVGAEVRVKVEAADNIFFDISNANFAIVEAVDANFAFNAPIVEGDRLCLPNSVTLDLTTAALAGFSEMISLSTGSLPTGVTATFSADQINAGDAATLTLDFEDDISLHGGLDFNIIAEATGVNTQERSVSYELISNDFSALTLSGPTDGMTGQSALVDFDWNDLANADEYILEVSTDPTFEGAALVVSESGLTESAFTVGLEGNTAYFWRVSVVNECGEGAASNTSSFHTVTQSCITQKSDDGPYNISSAGLPVIKSQIIVSGGGVISDVNVPNIKGNHVAVGDMEFRLVSPNSDVVVLFGDPTCGVNQFDFGFDDESSLSTPSPCSPNTGLVYKPKEALSAFIGQDVEGIWTLEAAVVNDLGDGGTFESWDFEYCGSFEVNNPFLVNNNALRVPPNDSRAIFTDSLLVQDADNGANDLEYTVVATPEFGTLLLNGNALDINGTFTQADIDNFRVRYQNDDDTATDDSFTFVVRDGDGGFLGTPRFNFIIDPGAIVNTTDFDLISTTILYPNPAKDLVNIEFQETLNTHLEVSILNVQGQILNIVQYDNVLSTIQLNTSDLASGIYMISIKMNEEIITKRVVIE
jgi:hypothetical protein